MQVSKYTDKMLLFIKNKGPQTAGSLAAILNMTSMGVRQHLQALEQRHLVASYDSTAGVGRPKRYWRLTEQAQEHFPDSHGDLTRDLLMSVERLFGQGSIERLVDEREQQVLMKYQEEMKVAEDLGDKVKRLTHLRRQEGYMAEFQSNADGSYRLQENHCPIATAASCCQQLCTSELRLFQTVLGKEVVVQRQSHILSGSRYCAYRITPIHTQGV